MPCLLPKIDLVVTVGAGVAGVVGVGCTIGVCFLVLGVRPLTVIWAVGVTGV